jgi:kumamolisin
MSRWRGARAGAWGVVLRALCLAACVGLLLPAAGYDFANGVQQHAGSRWGTSSAGPQGLAALLRAYPGIFTPRRFRRAYQLPADLTGSGQTIALIEAENGFSAPALRRFDRAFGLPPAHVTVVYAGAAASAPPGAANETMLDTEWAHAIAPGARLAVIVWQVPPLATGGGALAAALSSVHPDVVSASAVDAGPWALAAARAGLTLGWSSLRNYPAFVSTGDGGDGVGLPALLPSVAAVGGMEEAGGQAVPWPSSGHGFADWTVARPSWQTGNPSPWRGVPDVVWLAGAPTLATYVQGWVALEGTSAAAPQWAALWALADQRRAELGKAPLAAPAPAALYRIAEEDPGAYVQPAGARRRPWDPVSGLGRPDVPAFLAAAAALPAGCCRAAPPPVGRLPQVAALFVLAVAMYVVAAGLPRRSGRLGWPSWSAGIAALGAAAYLLAEASPIYNAVAGGAYLAAVGTVYLRRGAAR